MNTIDTSSPQPIGIGQKLRAAREAMHLTPKDAALRLHLHTDVIDSLENETQSPDLPTVFYRGYLRAYGRMLQISEQDIQGALLRFPLTDPIPTRIHVPVNDPSLPNAGSQERISRRLGYAMFAGVIGLVMIFIYTTHNAKSKDLPLAQTTTTLEAQAPTPAADTVATPPTPPTTAALETAAPTADAAATDNSVKKPEKIADNSDSDQSTAHKDESAKSASEKPKSDSEKASKKEDHSDKNKSDDSEDENN